MRNPKDLSRCHCGGRYELLAPTRGETRDGVRYPATCRACYAFRYLSEYEAGMARQLDASDRLTVNRFTRKD